MGLDNPKIITKVMDLAMEMKKPCIGINNFSGIHIIIRVMLDNQEFLEVHGYFVLNDVVCFGRLNGRSVGVIAN